MRSLRRLSVVSIASLPAALLLFTTGVSAQTAPAPSARPTLLQNPVPFVAPILPPLSAAQLSAQQLPAPYTTLRVPPLSPKTIHRLGTMDPQKLILLAQNNGPCYTLRTYGFTTGHDPAEAPRLSSHTTCTPASKSHVRELVNAPKASTH